MTAERPAAADPLLDDSAVDDRSVSSPRRGRIRALVIVMCSCTAVLMPIAHGALGLIRDGWLPDLDNAAIAARVGQILDGHVELVGMPSTLQGEVIGPKLVTHHPGPLLFWLLTPLYGLSGRSAAAIIVSAGFITASAALTIVVLGYRRHATRGIVVSAVAVALLERSMTTDLLVSVFNPYVSILPLVAATVCIGSIAAGDRLAWLPFVFFSTFVAQSHLSGVLPGAALFALAIVVQIWVARSGRPANRVATVDVAVEPTARGHARWNRSRFGIGIAAFTAALWMPVLIDQLFGSHNLTNLLRATSQRPESGGMRFGFGFVASALGLPARFMMGDHRGTALAVGPSLWIASMIAASMVGLAVLGWRLGLRSEAIAVGGSLLPLIVCGMQASRVPTDAFTPAPWIFTTWHVNYWVLSLGCASWLTTALLATSLIRQRLAGTALPVFRSPLASIASGALVVIMLGLAAAAPGRSINAAGTERLSSVIRDMSTSTLRTTGGGRWLAQVNVYSASVFGGVMADLMASDAKILLPDDTVYYWGEPTRCDRRQPLDGVLLFRREPDGPATDLPPGARLVARTRGPAVPSRRLAAAIDHLESVLEDKGGVTYDPSRAERFVSRVPRSLAAGRRNELLPPFTTVRSESGQFDGWSIVGILELADAGIIVDRDVRDAARQVDQAGFGSLTDVGRAATFSVYAAPASTAVGCGP